MPGVIGASAAIVLAWGYFLMQGVRDPLGGINSLWPLFGIANQLLAAIALSVATTILLKMHGARYAWVTLAPLAWIVTVTYTAAWQKIFSPLPRVGFLAQASQLESAIANGAIALGKPGEMQAVIFNARLDAVVCGIFLVLVTMILIDSIRLWIGIARGTRPALSREAAFVPTRLGPEETW
jgi:carbon starvation protein